MDNPNTPENQDTNNQQEQNNPNTENRQENTQQEPEVVIVEQQFQQGPIPPNGNSAKNKATASLVLGIIAVVFMFFGWSAIVSIVLSIIGIVMGVEARKELPPDQTSMATAGMTLSVIALVLSGIVFVACVICGAAAGIATGCASCAAISSLAI